MLWIWWNEYYAHVTWRLCLRIVRSSTPVSTWNTDVCNVLSSSIADVRSLTRDKKSDSCMILQACASIHVHMGTWYLHDDDAESAAGNPRQWIVSSGYNNIGYTLSKRFLLCFYSSTLLLYVALGISLRFASSKDLHVLTRCKAVDILNLIRPVY